MKNFIERVRAEKMKPIDGIMHRWCPYCEQYLDLSHFRQRTPRKTKAPPSDSAKYQSDCKDCTNQRMVESRARRRGAIANVKV